MLTVETAKPHARLAPFVRAYVLRSTDTRGADILEPVIARLGTMLEFQFDRLYEIPTYSTNQIMFSPRVTVIGPVTGRRVYLVLRDHVQALAVMFQLHGFCAAFGVPTHLVTNIGMEAISVLGSEVAYLYEKLGNEDSFLKRARLLDEFLLHRLDRSRPLDTIHRALDRLIHPDVPCKVSEIASNAGVTPRQLEPKAQEYMGVSPKLMVRIARYQRAMQIKVASSIPWIEVSHAFGYHDQMHMIRDFHEFAGGPPASALQGITSDHLINL
jgi:AraC-like DNA-binding protein